MCFTLILPSSSPGAVGGDGGGGGATRVGEFCGVNGGIEGEVGKDRLSNFKVYNKWYMYRCTIIPQPLDGHSAWCTFLPEVHLRHRQKGAFSRKYFLFLISIFNFNHKTVHYIIQTDLPIVGRCGAWYVYKLFEKSARVS